MPIIPEDTKEVPTFLITINLSDLELKEKKITFKMAKFKPNPTKTGAVKDVDPIDVIDFVKLGVKIAKDLLKKSDKK